MNDIREALAVAIFAGSVGIVDCMEKIKASGFAYMPSKLDDGMMVLNIK